MVKRLDWMRAAAWDGNPDISRAGGKYTDQAADQSSYEHLGHDDAFDLVLGGDILYALSPHPAHQAASSRCRRQWSWRSLCLRFTCRPVALARAPPKHLLRPLAAAHESAPTPRAPARSAF